MQDELTPKHVEDAAVKARVPLTTFIRSAGVAPSVFYRWQNGNCVPRRLTLAKLADAVQAA